MAPCPGRLKAPPGQPIPRLVAAPSFADLLDVALGDAPPVAPATAGWAAVPLRQAPEPLLYARPLSPGAAWARVYPRPVVPPRAVVAVEPPAPRPAAESIAAASEPPVAPAPEPPNAAPAPPPAAADTPSPPRRAAASPRPVRPVPRAVPMPPVARRLLTSPERRALERLCALGARLDDRFTADDLRRAYRHLALQLHPDRHVALTPVARVKLADAFARATEAYRCLRAVPDAA